MTVGGFQGSMNKNECDRIRHSPWLHKTWLVYPVCCSTCNIGRLTSLFVSLKISLVGWHPSLCCCHPECQPMDCFCPHVAEITIFPSLLLEGGAISYDCCFKSQTVTRFEGQHCIRIVSRIAFGLNLHFCYCFSQREICWKHLAYIYFSKLR